MERLTYDFCVGDVHCWQVRGADNALCDGVCSEQQENGCKECPIGKAFDRLAAIENILGDEYDLANLRDLLQAEQDCRLVVLPCKVGDTVYQVDYMTHSEALKSGVPQSKDPYQNRKYGRKRSEYLPLIVREKKMTKSLFREFGKTVFLTREEAEAELAEKGGAG